MEGGRCGVNEAKMIQRARKARAEAVFRASGAVLRVVKDLQQKVEAGDYSSADVAELCKVWNVVAELPASEAEDVDAPVGLVMMPEIMAEPEE